MKKTLVIHPTDRSTDFLKIIYENHLNDWTILNDFVGTKEDLRKIISEHDRIIMMGHGTPYGLLNTGSFLGDFDWNIIDDSFVCALRKKETVSIWCNSDAFFREHLINGFHTGMIISETSEEQYMLNHIPLDKAELLANMKYFASIIRDCIDLEDNPYGMKDYILNRYNWDDEVTQFNRKNIIVVDSSDWFEERILDDYDDDWGEVWSSQDYEDDWSDE